ncbi:hypothetical protein [Mycobacterium phage WXIN]|nr:hypothetical protein [Mycobacterium phage WXIN]
MSYTIDELNAAIRDEESDWEGSWFEFSWLMESDNEWRETESGRQYVPKTQPGVSIPGIGRAVQLAQHGGMDQGSDLWLVFEVTDEHGAKRIFRRTGYWMSYSGGEYDGPTEEVEPVQKLITVWEAKQ